MSLWREPIPITDEERELRTRASKRILAENEAARRAPVFNAPRPASMVDFFARFTPKPTPPKPNKPTTAKRYEDLPGVQKVSLKASDPAEFARLRADALKRGVI